MTNKTGYLLSVTGLISPENAKSDQSLNAGVEAFVICPPERKRRKMGVVRKRLLDSISDYLYSRAQKVATAEERDAFTLALAIMEAVRHDVERPFEAACYRAFGSTLKVYLKRRAQWQWARHQELAEVSYDKQGAPPSAPIAWPVPRLQPAATPKPEPVREAPPAKRAAAKRLPKAAG